MAVVEILSPLILELEEVEHLTYELVELRSMTENL